MCALSGPTMTATMCAGAERNWKCPMSDKTPTLLTVKEKKYAEGLLGHVAESHSLFVDFDGDIGTELPVGEYLVVSANDTLYRLHDECGGTHERLTNCGTFDYCDNDSPCVVPVYPKEET